MKELNTDLASPIRLLNCASMSPWWPRWHVAGIVLLVITDQGPVLVDTGLGLHDHESPSGLVKFFIFDFGIHHAPEETAVRQVKRLGYKPEEIRHIVLTHLHFDHAGGLPDFPWAQVHIHRMEYKAHLRPKTWIERYAYDRKDFAHQPKWVLYDLPDEKWYDFDVIRLPFKPDMFFVPLLGHTSGHCGVAIRDGKGWHFHCADALPINAEFDITPNWLNRMVIGDHVRRLKAFSLAHPEVKMTAGHTWRSITNP